MALNLWLCLHFPQLPLEIFTRGMPPEDSERPVVVLERQRVAFLNAAAGAAGIQPGNSMDTAFSLARLVHSIERDETKEAAALAQLARWSDRFTPVVCIGSEDALLLEISGCLTLFGGLRNLRDLIARGLDELGYQCRCACAATPLAALMLAKAGRDPGEEVALRDALADVPVDFMMCDGEIVAALHNMGIHRMDALLRLPFAELGRRFGRGLVDSLDRLTGRRPDPQKAIAPAPDFRGEIHFLHDVTNTASLLFPMKRLLAELGDFLLCRQLATERIDWELSHRNHATEHIVVRLARPERDPARFLTLTGLQLDRFTGMAEIDSLALIAKRFSAASLLTGELFRELRDRNGPREDGARMQLLNVLRARLGAETCFGISLANDHRPEHAWKRVRPGRVCLDQDNNWQPSLEGHESPRPLYLLDPARPLRVRGGEPLLEGPLTLLRGPERIDFGWWERDTPRDYYIARHGSGALYWIFKHLTNDRWYLHGIFS